MCGLSWHKFKLGHDTWIGDSQTSAFEAVLSEFDFLVTLRNKRQANVTH